MPGNDKQQDKGKADGPLSLRTLIVAAVIALASAGLGLAANVVRPRAIPWVFQQTPPEKTRDIDLAEAKDLFDSGDALFLDSRSVAEYRAGHIPGSMNLDISLSPQGMAELLTGIKPDRQLVVYCSGEGCHSSAYLAQRLVEMGYTNIAVFFGGWPEWVGAGYPVEGSERTGGDEGKTTDPWASPSPEQGGESSPWGAK